MPSRGYAAEALAWTDRVMTRLGLGLNRTKTCVRNARQERFDFLGYSFTTALLPANRDAGSRGPVRRKGERATEVDPVSWSRSGFQRRLVLCPKPAARIHLEFRRQMVDLVRAGRDPADLAREFEPTAQSIRNWVGCADRQEGGREEKGVALRRPRGRDELVRLQRENKQLRLERDILSRAAAWFARETGTIPSGSSSS